MMEGKILIADDEPAFVRLLRMSLEPLGLRIRETYDAISALSLIQREPPDVVILDVNMPGGTGLGAGEMLASDKWLVRVPIIILSGQCDDLIQERCRRIGARFVKKGPEAIAEVRRIVREVLAARDQAAAPATTR